MLNFRKGENKLKHINNELSEQHKELIRIIRRKDKLDEAIELFLDIHSQLHSNVVSHDKPNYVNPLINDLKDNEYKIMPNKTDETIAWTIWHITRIEDLTMNILIADEKQVFNNDWKVKMNVNVSDTGNAMTDDEIMKLSKDMFIEELLKYRDAVGLRTQEIVKNLKPEDMKKKIPQERLSKIVDVGGLTEDKNSIWLLDYWGDKDYAGLLLMPPTRHLMMHINDCYKWKEAIRTKKKFFNI